MRTRFERNADFEKFGESAGAIFNRLMSESDGYLQLEKIYSFFVTRDTCINVCYGKKQYTVAMGDQSGNSINTRTESGAQLRIYANDFGFVQVQLFPAETQFFKHKEEFILLYASLDPKCLLKPVFQRRLMRRLNSYMAVTCLDARPTICDKSRVARLRIIKLLCVGGKLQQRRLLTWLGSIFKYVLTVGLSGFLLLVIEKCF